MFLGTALDAPFRKANVERRYKASGARRKCSIHKENCCSKDEDKDSTVKRSLVVQPVLKITEHFEHF